MFTDEELSEELTSINGWKDGAEEAKQWDLWTAWSKAGTILEELIRTRKEMNQRQPNPSNPIDQVQRLTLGPNDILVVKVKAKLSNDSLIHLKDNLRNNLTGIIDPDKVMILADGTELVVIEHQH